jgi:hypothetical protein
MQRPQRPSRRFDLPNPDALVSVIQQVVPGGTGTRGQDDVPVKGTDQEDSGCDEDF